MKRILLALLLLCVAARAEATNYVWSGSASTSLSTSTNWTPNGTPATNSVITLTSTGTYLHRAARVHAAAALLQNAARSSAAAR